MNRSFSTRDAGRIAKAVGYYETAQGEGTRPTDTPPLPLAVYRAKLTAALSAGGNATANPMTWDEDSSAWSADTSTTITVYDDDGGHAAASGDELRVWPVGESDGTRWQVLAHGTRVAERIKFQVKGAVSSAATSFTVDNVEVVGPNGATSPVASAATELTVYRDTAGYSIDDNATGRAERDDAEGGNWYAYVLDENC